MIESLIASMPMFVAAFWSVMLLLNYLEQRSAITLRLLHFMLTAFALYACHYVYFSTSGHVGIVTETLYRYCNLAVYPLYYTYLQSLTLRRVQGWKTLLWLLPAIVLPLFGLFWAQTKIVAKVVFAMEVVGIAWLGVQSLRRYARMIAQNYADTENRSLAHIRYLFNFFILTSLFSFVANLLGREAFVQFVALLALPSTLFSVLLFMLGYVGVREIPSVIEVQHDLAENDDENLVAMDMVSRATDTQAESEEREKFEALTQRIQQVMDEEQLFLHPNLKINDLARRLGSNRNYIYQAVNVELGISFSEFVNHRRIDYAIRFMKENPDYVITDVYMKCGFSSLSAFYRNFRSYKGCSPTDYLVERAT